MDEKHQSGSSSPNRLQIAKCQKVRIIVAMKQFETHSNPFQNTLMLATVSNRFKTYFDLFHFFLKPKEFIPTKINNIRTRDKRPRGQEIRESVKIF
jgi:hypothetical protein